MFVGWILRLGWVGHLQKGVIKLVKKWFSIGLVYPFLKRDIEVIVRPPNIPFSII